MIGTYGDLVFEASSERIRTFKEYQRQGSARWAKSDVLGGKPRSQFIGPGQENITFVMELYAHFGIDVENELKRLHEWRDEGRIERLILDGKPQGARNARWYIDKIEEEAKFWNNEGKLLATEVTITLAEYF